ncbi:HTH-type transcriptional repressor YtrA [Listeria weihenstephanensis FSL R9-0317]|nr:HTH-type transcriptional repressor YtrA [Listeria weihenstephanensis FSL R9-0317]
MLLEIDLQAEEPIYTQIMYQIIEGIAKEELKPGDDLPSVRSLASDIGINFHTVNKAYQLLKQEGYILIHRQKGVVIHPDGIEKATEAFYAKLRKKNTTAYCRVDLSIGIERRMGNYLRYNL